MVAVGVPLGQAANRAGSSVGGFLTGVVSRLRLPLEFIAFWVLPASTC